MPLEQFKASDSLTMGVELELQLVNPAGRDLYPVSNEMLRLLEKSAFPGDVKPEITQSMIEISTDVHTRHDAMLGQLQSMRDALVAAGDELGVELCGGGTHPFQKWSERRIFSKPRFEEISELYGYLAKQFTVFGQHVHIGCSSADEGLYLLHALGRYLPHFIALSASSPYSQGVDTQFDSARLNSIFAFPMSGRAPFILKWSEFERDYFAKMEKTGVVKTMKDFYWDIRPKPEYGTIELRVCDTPLTVERAAALAAYLQALCRMLLSERDTMLQEDDYLVYNYNRFQASRYGLDGIFVHPRTLQRLPIAYDIIVTLRAVRSHAELLGSASAIDELIAVANGEGNDAALLRRCFSEQDSVEAMVAKSVAIFRQSNAP